MKTVSGLILVFAFYISVQAQKKHLILEKQLVESRIDTQRSRLLHELDWIYADLPITPTISFLEKSSQTTQQTGNTKAAVLVMYRLSYVYMYFVRDETKMLEWLNKCVSLATQIGDDLILSHCYSLLAISTIHQKIGDAESLLKKALIYAQKTKDWRIQSQVNELLAVYYLLKKDFKASERYNLKAMKLSENHDNKKWLSISLDYCDILQHQGRTREMNAYFKKMALVAQKIKRDVNNYVLMNDLARLQTKLQNYDNAEQLYFEVLNTERAKTWPDTFHLANVYRYLLSNYITQNQYQKAYDIRTKLTEIELYLSQKRQTESSKLQITKMQAALEVASKENEIVLITAKQKQQNLYLIGAIIVSLLLISLAWIVWRSRQKAERQKVELSQLNSTKDKLFAILSHDLRSPVASLKNYLMLIDWGVLSQEEFVESAKRLNTALNNTHNMLENVLNWAITQLGGSKPNIENVRVTDVISEQIKWQEAVADEKNINVLNTIAPEIVLKIDKNHLSVIIRNLLQNALKFTPVGGQILFDFQDTMDQKALTIKDNGPGISKEKLQDLFQINKNNANAKPTNGQGTGLGLVLVKELVEVNGGKIKAESSLHQGTTFTINFG